MGYGVLVDTEEQSRIFQEGNHGFEGWSKEWQIFNIFCPILKELYLKKTIIGQYDGCLG